MNTTTAVTLTFTNTDTGEVRQLDVKNTNTGHDRLLAKNSRMGRVTLHPYPLAKNCAALTSTHATRSNNTIVDSSHAPRIDSTMTTWWYERRFRFNSTGSTETIRTVCGINGTIAVMGYVVLDSDEYQQPNEVLDVTYRVIYELDMSTYAKRTSTLIDVATSTIGAFTNQTYIHLMSAPITEHIDDFGYLGAADTYKQTVPVVTSGGYTKSGFIGETEGIGKVFTSLCAGNSYQNISPIAIPMIVSRIGVLAGPDSKYPNYPLGPLINHGANSAMWYEELSHLASGLGYPVVSATGATYTTENNADMHTIKITQSGNVGTSKYILGISNAGGGYIPGQLHYSKQPIYTRCRSSPLTSIADVDRVTQHKDINSVENKVLEEYAQLHGWWYNSNILVTASNTRAYGANGASSTAFGFHNIATDKYIHIDKFTSPATPVDCNKPNTKQCYARDNAGKVYIALRDQGILTITNVMTAPALTLISKATIGTTHDIVALAHGYQDRIWFVSVGDVGYSDDNGTSWTVKPPYTFVGSDNNTYYQKGYATSIVASPTAHELAIGYNTNPITDRFTISGWYDPVANELLKVHNAYSQAYYSFTPMMCTNKGAWFILATKIYAKQGYVGWNQTSLTWGNLVRCTSAITSSWVTDGMFIEDKLGNEVLIGTQYHATTADYGKTCLMPDRIRVGSMKLDQRAGLAIHNGRYDVLDGLVKHGAYGICGLYNSSGAQVMSSLGVYNHYDPYLKDYSADRTRLGSLDGVELDREIASANKIYRLNASSAWEADYNAPATATADGSSSADATRVNFSTDSSYFHGRCYLNPTASLAGIDFSTGGMTIAATYTPVAKILHPTPTSPADGRYCNLEEISHVCFQLRDSTTGNTIIMYYNNNLQNMVLEEATNITQIDYSTLTTDPVLEESRIVVTLSADGTTVKVFKNNTQLGSSITLNTAMPMANAANSLVLTVGSKSWSHEINKEYYFNIFKGDITNIQVWNDVWDATDITSDNSDRSGLITSASNLVSRYLMTSTDYSEAKLTHSASAPTPYGLDVGFGDGDLSSDSYVADEWYNVAKRKYGILKDNITEFNYYGTLTHNRSSTGGVISDDNGLTTVPLTVTEVTQPIGWAYTQVVTDAATGSACSYSHNRMCRSVQSSTEDITLEFTIAVITRSFSVAIAKVTDKNHPVASLTFSTLGTNVVNFSGVGATQQTLTAPTEANEKYKLFYDATLFQSTVYHWDVVTTAWVQIGTTITVTDPADALHCTFKSLYGTIDSHGTGGITDATITYTPPCAVMRYGSKTSETGMFKWDSTTHMLDSNKPLDIHIDGDSIAGSTTTGNHADSIMHAAYATLVADEHITLGNSGYILIDEGAHGGSVITSSDQTIDNKGNLPLV